jgi:hypothetical protein
MEIVQIQWIFICRFWCDVTFHHPPQSSHIVTYARPHPHPVRDVIYGRPLTLNNLVMNYAVYLKYEICGIKFRIMKAPKGAS